MINTAKLKFLALAPFALLVPHGCAAPTKPPVVFASEHYANAGGRTNVSPPQRLDLWMDDGGTVDQIRTRCDSYGGTDLVQLVPGGLLVCEGVDY